MTREGEGARPPRSTAQSLVRWEQRFSVGEYLFGERPNAYLASKAHLLPKGGRALSIADGEGRNSVWLAQQGLRVDAFDFSPTAVKKAERLALARAAQVNHSVSEMFAWNWTPAAYDLVAAIFIQFATPAEREKLFALIQGTLKPGGLLVLDRKSVV
jgi:2-polyprenyl-3-methyl-5-hydroxy-6-metoxy-1,4-benzoquinol methylase